MDTGSGKTLISLLLIKWMTAQEQSKGKLVIFLVPQVALVEQQGKVLSKHTNLKVVKLHGSLELDLSDRSGWQKRFESNDVFIMTGIRTFSSVVYFTRSHNPNNSPDISQYFNPLALEH